ncbi:hypothetical protein AWV79_04375 [Cupriavidus sp. UYMMa02A]|nr:hypothetical protein AWV79_04375 [Cupriavidus sp. UYMMa02A]
MHIVSGGHITITGSDCKSLMRDEGISVLLVEQKARMSLEIADHAYVREMAPSFIREAHASLLPMRAGSGR